MQLSIIVLEFDDCVDVVLDGWLFVSHLLMELVDLPVSQADEFFQVLDLSRLVIDWMLMVMDCCFGWWMLFPFMLEMLFDLILMLLFLLQKIMEVL